MNILLIGNGFDLEHKLPTTYWDFMCFIKSFKSLSLQINPKNKFKTTVPFKDLNSNVQEFLINDEVFFINNHNIVLKELAELIKDNIWIDYFIEKINEYKDKGWIDFETEISKVIQNLDHSIKYSKKLILDTEKNDDTLTETYNFLKIKLKKDIEDAKAQSKLFKFYVKEEENIIYILNEDLNNLIRALEIYLGECVEKIDIKHKSPSIENLKIDKILNFNYTNTYEKIYDKNCKAEYNYIHGKIEVNRKITENNMVLGIDEYLDEKFKNKHLEYIFFKKYFQRIYKKTCCNYKCWIEEVKKNTEEKNELYIFGHSLDVTDKDILKDLIENKNIRTTIFYYNKKAYAQQITNLVKIIGQDKLIASIYEPNATIIFKQQ